MARDDVFNPVGGQFYVGLSSVIGLTCLPGQNFLLIKATAAGNSGLYVGGASLSVGLAGITYGMQMATGEQLSWSYCDTLNFSAAGSTATVSYLIGRSSPVST